MGGAYHIEGALFKGKAKFVSQSSIRKSVIVEIKRMAMGKLRREGAMGRLKLCLIEIKNPCK